ncbi:C-Jun-amino-terminal kinase-interacting protein 2 [Chytriomyces hyalinus]|nr:C-Jun-amino-terminal kinase-interacting protein 2 [Chytriomyces hyalinus]
MIGAVLNLATLAAASAAHIGVSRHSAAKEGGKCVSIDATSVCAPWSSQALIDVTAVSAHYGANLATASDWASAVSASGSPDYFAKVLNCPGLDAVHFMRSYICIRDIYALSLECGNKPPSPPPCSDTCDEFSRSIALALNDPSTCPTLAGPKAAPGWEGARTAALASGDACRKLTASWGGDVSDDSCSESVTEDYNACGFAGNSLASQEFCGNFPQDSKPICCSHVKAPTSALRKSAHFNSYIESVAGGSNIRAASQPSNANEQNQGPPPPPPSGLSGGAIAAIVIVCVLVICAVAAVFVVSKRHTLFDIDHPINRVLGSSGRRTSIKRGASMYKRDRGELSQYRHHLHSSNSMEYSSVKSESNETLLSPSNLSAVPGTTFSLGGAEKRVVLEYTANLPDELSLRVGETVSIVEMFDDGWIRGVHVRTNKKGLFPSQCVGITPPPAVNRY